MDEDDASVARWAFWLREEGTEHIAVTARFATDERAEMVEAAGEVILLFADRAAAERWTTADDDPGRLSVVVIPDLKDVSGIAEHRAYSSLVPYGTVSGSSARAEPEP